MQAVEHLLHPGKLELAVARLPTAPRRLAHADDGETGLPHQLDVGVEPLVRHVLRVVRNTIEDGAHTGGGERGPWRRGRRRRQRGRNDAGDDENRKQRFSHERSLSDAAASESRNAMRLPPRSTGAIPTEPPCCSDRSG